MGDLKGQDEVKWTERRKDVRGNKTQSNIIKRRREKEQDRGERIRPYKKRQGVDENRRMTSTLKA